MTENIKQEKRANNLIPAPVQKALLWGSGVFLVSAGLHAVPPEDLISVAGVATGLSLIFSAAEVGGRKAARRKRGRQIAVNGVGGQRTINLEYSLANGGYIARKTWGETFTELIFGKAQPVVRDNDLVTRPRELDEFMFHSRGVQLRECHVKLFLASAWRNRKYGSGLSERHWIRGHSQRPAWYKELPTDWYYAMMGLLFDTQSNLKNSQGQHIHMVVVKANNWMDLASEPYLTLIYLKYFERQKRRAGR